MKNNRNIGIVVLATLLSTYMVMAVTCTSTQLVECHPRVNTTQQSGSGTNLFIENWAKSEAFVQSCATGGNTGTNCVNDVNVDCVWNVTYTNNISPTPYPYKETNHFMRTVPVGTCPQG